MEPDGEPLGEHRPIVLTLGHSNHELEHVLHLLEHHQVGRLIDVRSAPYSRYNPRFNRQALERTLPARDIEYVFQGQNLGGRPDDPDCYDGAGHVIYDRLEESANYREGIDVVLRAVEAGHRVCLLCSEEDPAVCHRALSIGHFLTERDVSVHHIRGDGTIEKQSELRGKAINKPVQSSLFEEVPPRKSLQPVSQERALNG